MDPGVARRMWELTEPVHAVVYFSPASRQVIEDAGLRGFWRGYFATRASPLEHASADVVAAAFYNFSPAMVARAIPAVWDLIEPDAAWSARVRAADAALGPLLDGDAIAAVVARAAGLLREAVDACSPEGRVLFAAHRRLDWPDEPHLAVWHAATLLREHRGDGHNAALVAHGIDGCAAHVLADTAGSAPRSVTQPNRGWTDDDWSTAAAGLVERGGLLPDGGLGAQGRALLDDIELRTNEASLAPWRRIGAGGCAEVEAALAGLTRRILAADWFPHPNPIGLTGTAGSSSDP